jgi:hypothetical protein
MPPKPQSKKRPEAGRLQTQPSPAALFAARLFYQANTNNEWVTKLAALISRETRDQDMLQLLMDIEPILWLNAEIGARRGSFEGKDLHERCVRLIQALRTIPS